MVSLPFIINMNAEVKRKLKAMTAKKETLFQRMQLLYDKSKGVKSEIILKEFIIRFQTVEATKKQFEELVDNINLINAEADDDFVSNYQELNAIDELYCHIKDVAAKVIKPDIEVISIPAAMQRAETAPRLPKIELLSFDGDAFKWPLFYETFKSLIHENTKLDNVSKIHYLLGKLSGKALSITTGMLPTADNYPILWAALIEKYEDKRALASRYLSQILEFKIIQNEGVSQFNAFLEKIDGSISALKNLKVPDLADFMLMTIALTKLDSQTQRLFERSLNRGLTPSYQELSEFIKDQTKILERTMGQSTQKQYSAAGSKPNNVHSFATNENNALMKNTLSKCLFCRGGGHRLYKCFKYLNLSPTERVKFAQDSSLCFNCLNPNHIVTACTSTSLCQKCNKRHHTVLHLNHAVTPHSTPKIDTPETSSNHSDLKQLPVSLCSTSTEKVSDAHYTILLATAVVQVISLCNEKHQLRFLIDSASQCNFITNKCCQKLGLPISKAYTSVTGIGNGSKQVRGQTHLTFSSQVNPAIKYHMKALIIDKITDELPTCMVDSNVYKQFGNLRLADDNFGIPGEIHGMIGAELVPHILDGTKFTGPDMPVAINSSLGFIIMGKARSKQLVTNLQTYCCVNSSENIETLLQKFWELDEIAAEMPIKSSEDSECEKLFTSSVKRETDGRYIVSLPFKVYPPNLGDSYSIAFRRFCALERKFVSCPVYKEKYAAVIQDYLDQGHMMLVPPGIAKSPGYYIPHHGVTKDSASTPLRVVFDASAKTDLRVSLNDTLYTGEKLQTDVFTILINFRLLPHAMTSDVRQMYRQIKLSREHQPYQRLLWRFSNTEPVQTYELTTVAFGLKSSPYLALRTVHQLAADERISFPLAAEAVARDIYMDDLVCSVDNLTIANQLYNELLGLFTAGGFEIVKWATNSWTLLENIPESIRSDKVVDFKQDFLKVLGLQWHPADDCLTFTVKFETRPCTKRNILSTVARMWDPLGLLSPVTIYAKLLIKKLWLLKLSWDEAPPISLQQLWNEFQDNLGGLSSFKIPRHIGVSVKTPLSLLGFSDASERAYGAAIYARTVDNNGKILVTLLCAKAKVAPLKTISIPRLELCSALLLAKLLNLVINTYLNRCTISRVCAFSDSMVVLNWIHSSPHRWKTFVANRVTKIHSLLDPSCWLHVNGEENPADCASRGLSPKSFLKHALWLSGPPWISLDETEWPGQPVIKNNLNIVSSEEKPVSLAVIQPNDHPLYLLILKCSSWRKLLNVTTRVLQFGKLLPLQKVINADNLAKSEIILVRIIQNIYFAEEIRALEQKNSCSPTLRHLRPFIQDGVLRVGGRLANAAISYDQQHPILLPKQDHFTKLLIDHYHRTNLHTGPHLLLSLLRQKYWVLAARGLVRQRVQNCNHCFRLKPRSDAPLMADLPSARVGQAKAFLHTGIDYAGPFHITLSRHRGVKCQKAYLCLFVCMVTRAVHLELASDLTTDTFLAAFKRFLARRGPCSVVYSDCGTNFVGAKNALDSLLGFAQSSSYTDALKNELAQRQIMWKFNPPSAPHFGGVWEANIKSVKNHLSKVIGAQILSYEEFLTVLTQIEALLNSRPLCWLSSDPAEPLALTPAHFLTLTPLQSLPVNDETDKPINRLTRKELLDQIVQSYWKRWFQEYLSGLQSRQKWNTPSCPVKPGLLVVIHQDSVPPLQWPLGIIEQVFPGKDNVIRVATVRTRDGVYKRPVIKLCPLPTQ